MKKLTAGIFATILGVTAMGAADAAVTSKGYVDTAIGKVAQSVTDLGTDIAKDYATKKELSDEKDILQGNIDELAGTVGTLPEGITATTVVGYVDEKIAGVDAAGLQEEIDKKANSADVYTKTEADNLLNLKANSADVYTKTEVNNTFATQTDLQDEEDARISMDADLQAAIDAIESGIGGIETAGEGADGLYALTKKVTTDAEGKQVVTYVWELIDREYVETDVTPNNQ